MSLNNLKKRLKKFLKYLTLGSLTTLLTLWLGLGAYPQVAGMTRVDAATSDAPAVQSSVQNTSELVQEGLQRYQSGQFAAAVKVWQQAADTFAQSGDRINQAMVLSNLALTYHQLGLLPEANRAITTSLQLLQTEGTDGDEVSQENLKLAREAIESLQLAELDNFFREACLTAQPQQIDLVDPNAAVIYPIILPDRLEVILSLPKKQPLRHYATAIPQSELSEILNKARRSLRRTALDEERLPLFQNVYDWLVRPAESELLDFGQRGDCFAIGRREY